MASLSTLLKPEAILDLEFSRPSSIPAILEELCAAAAEHLEGLDTATLLDAVRAREDLVSTGFGEGLAMPHVRLEGVKRVHVVVARTREGVEFDSIDGLPVRLFCLIVGAERDRDRYQKVMGRAARFLKSEGQRLIASDDLVGDVLSASEAY